MTDVVERIFDVHSANLLLQWSSAKGQSLAEDGVAKHLVLEVGSKVVSIWYLVFGPASTYATWSPASNLENSQIIHSTLYNITELALGS